MVLLLLKPLLGLLIGLKRILMNLGLLRPTQHRHKKRDRKPGA